MDMDTRERPILFSAPMVRAILSGAKTQTRRIAHVPARGQNGGELREVVPSLLVHRGEMFDARYELDNPVAIRCPYGAPGDRLWVRETFALSHRDDDVDAAPKDRDAWDWPPVYRADGEAQGGGWSRRTEDGEERWIAPPWRPAIHMPRWASRILLEVTDVRVERVQAITEEDARAEGVTLDMLRGTPAEGAAAIGCYRAAFSFLWNSINGKRASWASNPWVWVVSFRRIVP